MYTLGVRHGGDEQQGRLPAAWRSWRSVTGRGCGWPINGDGRDDLAVMYRYGANDMGINVFAGTAGGLANGWSQPYRSQGGWSCDASKL